MMGEELMLTQGNEVGVGLRRKHFEDILLLQDKPPWLEVHSENFLSGGKNLEYLQRLRQDCDISLHGVSLSLGSSSLPSKNYLHRLKELADIIDPFMISDHVSWSMHNGKYLNDLLPIPYNQHSLDVICRNISYAQDILQRRLLVENPSTYLQFNNSTMSEIEFLCQIVKRTGCLLLLDLNNVYVNSYNHGIEPLEYIGTIPSYYIGEIHLSGHSHVTLKNGSDIIVDTHSDHVCDGVWSLYEKFLACYGPKPTLIEWDDCIPDLPILLQEMRKANDLISYHAQEVNQVRGEAYA